MKLVIALLGVALIGCSQPSPSAIERSSHDETQARLLGQEKAVVESDIRKHEADIASMEASMAQTRISNEKLSRASTGSMDQTNNQMMGVVESVLDNKKAELAQLKKRLASLP